MMDIEIVKEGDAKKYSHTKEKKNTQDRICVVLQKILA